LITRILVDGAAVGTCIGVFVAALQLRLNGQQAKTEFEDRMTEVYRDLAAQLPVEVFFSDTEVEPELVQEKREVFYRYFDLCNEQAFLRRRRRIRRRTWEEWQAGIKGNMGRDAFDYAWYELIEPHIGEDFEDFKKVLEEVTRPAGADCVKERLSSAA
jgi:hypothetical protein